MKHKIRNIKYDTYNMKYTVLSKEKRPINIMSL